jgi:hypothetical protein
MWNGKEEEEKLSWRRVEQLINQLRVLFWVSTKLK